ncbi:MAG: biopolymer transporter ExbD [Bacteroidetes bacterium]|jgi:biopolymer transport protein ExbD|nr:biopolymer transporter ExbD [Bacteroidota bacterium]
MKIGRRKREEAEVESSSLNDIMFFLLLFFLIASTLANPNVIKVMLPQAKTTSTVSPKSIPLTVRRDPANPELLQVFIEQEEVNYNQLESRLKELRDQYNDPEHKDAGLVVVLRADSKAYVQDLVDVMQVGANLGIKMVLATEKNKK